MEGIRMDFEECVRSRRILRIDPSQDIIEKEMEGSLYDLRRAKDNLKSHDYKWASIQAYYSMFHAGKALLISAGFREKSHGCLIIGLRALYVEKGKMPEDLVQDLEDSMYVRMDADYGLIFKEESAMVMVDKADRFHTECKRILSE